jgi:hypothetical protein
MKPHALSPMDPHPRDRDTIDGDDTIDHNS